MAERAVIIVEARDNATRTIQQVTGDTKAMTASLERAIQATMAATPASKALVQAYDAMDKAATAYDQKLHALVSAGMMSEKQAFQYRMALEQLDAEFGKGKLSQEGYTKAVQTVGRAMEQSADKGALFSRLGLVEPGTQASRLSGILTGLTSKVMAMGAAYISVRGLKMAHSLALTGAQAEMTERSFARMTASVGVSASVLNDMKRAAAGTIPELQLMQALNTSLIGVSSEFGRAMADAYPQLVEMARAASIANPALGDVGYMIRSLSIGLKRMSPLIIDNLGIQLKLGEVNKNYAAQLGKTTKELTMEEKQMALLNATLKSGARLVEQVGISSDNASVKHQALGAAFADTRVEIGKSLDWLLGYQGALTKLVQFVREFTEEQNFARDTSRTFGDAIRRLHEQGEISWGTMVKLENQLGALHNQFSMGYISAGKYEDRVWALVSAYAENDEGLRKLNPKIIRLIDYFERARGAAMGFTGGLMDSAKELREYTEDLSALENATRALGAAFQLIPSGDPVLKEQLKYQSELWDNWRTEQRYATQTYVDTRNAVEYGGWETLWNYVETGDKKAVEQRTRRQEQAARKAASAWQSEFRSTVGTFSMMMTSTMPEDWWKKMLPRQDEWDEWARRAADVANLGPGSPWFQTLMEKFPTFKELVEAKGPQVGAAEWIQDFYQFQVPEAINTDVIMQQYQDKEMTAANKQAVATALGIGDTDLSSIIGEGGADFATTLVDNYEEQMKNAQPAGIFIDRLAEDRESRSSQLVQLGKLIGEDVDEGIIDALEEPDFLGIVANAVAPEVARILGMKWG